MEEEKKSRCIECGGSGVCPYCDGDEETECDECGSDGKCAACEGTGEEAA